MGWVGGDGRRRGEGAGSRVYSIVLIIIHTHTHTGKDINAFAFSPLNLSNPLIFRIVKYAKVAEVNR